MPSIDRDLPPDDWKPDANFNPPPALTGTADGSGGSLEVVIGVNNLLGIAWLNRGVELSSAVVRVLVKGTSDVTGTGFLVASDLLLTNNHVLPDSATALASTVEFDYQLLWNGQLAPTKTFPVVKFERTSVNLDYTLVRVGSNPGTIFGFVDPTNRADAGINDFVVIIQQPGGGPKQVALMDNKVSAVFGNVLQYTTDTEPGSSGSPVFNTHWQLVGLHHAGGQLKNAEGGTVFTNEALRISDIVSDAQGLLGPVDPLYSLAFGELQSSLLKLIEIGLSGPTVADEATSLLNASPALADAVSSRLTSHAGTVSGSAAIAASGVGLGAALIDFLRSGSSGTIGSVAKVPPGPQPDLVTLASDLMTTTSAPVTMYQQLSERIEGDVSVIANLLAGEPASPDIGAAAQLLVESISAGAQAVAS